MDCNSKLDRLFEEWIAKSVEYNERQRDGHVVFTFDGLLEKADPDIDVETLWFDSAKRILFLVKDQPSEWSDDVRLWLRKENNRKLKPRFLRNIANVLWGLYTIDNPNDCDYDKVSEASEDVTRCFNTVPFALLESKKQGGTTRITDRLLKKYLNRYGDFLRKELDILSPNIIVCTNDLIYGFVIDYYNEKIADYPLRTIEGHNSIRIHPESQTLILNSFHPSARMGYKKFYDGVMNHYCAFLESEYFSQFKNLFGRTVNSKN